MSSELPPALDELIVDPHANKAQEQLLEQIRVLEEQGIPPRAIARAFARTLKSYCLEQYDKWGNDRLWARRFLHATGESLVAESGLIKSAERKFVAYRDLLTRADPAGEA